jgi:thiol-disulfide isomerase/thioredoxin
MAIVIVMMAAGTALFGQSMMSSSSPSGDASSMMSANALPGGDMTAAELRAAKGTGGKVLFTDLAAAQALAQKGPVVLFFAADWCPTCIEAMKDINANGARLSGVTVVVVDYDKEKDLKKLYRVTAQHTFVQINAKGEKLVAWNGGGVDVIVKRVTRG